MSGYSPSGYEQEEWDKIRRAIYERDDYTCQACGATDIKPHATHKTPLHKGGDRTLENLYTLCDDCQNKKYQQEFENPLSGIEMPGAAESASQATSESDVLSRILIGLIGVGGAMWGVMMFIIGVINQGTTYMAFSLAGPIIMLVCLLFILYGLTGYMPSISTE
jgi:uncharacterized protein (DUF983 family)